MKANCGPSMRSARNLDQLKERIGYFLWRRPGTREPIGMVLSALGGVGPAAIFGGVLRDLALKGSRGFCSDVDIVVDVTDIDALERALFGWKPHKNKFGGYRFSVGEQAFDVWSLHDTWAFRNGHIGNPSFGALTQTTAFNWDAIVFEVNTGHIRCPEGYFRDIAHRIVDVNLIENPSPVGVAVRTLRMANLHKAKLAPRLLRHLATLLRETGPQTVSDAERRAYRHAILSTPYVSVVRDRLTALESEEISTPVGLTAQQLELPVTVSFSPS